MLFIIFIDDMPDVVETSMKLFADDAKIFKAIYSFQDISVIQGTTKLLKWSTEWQLPLNINKSKCILYGKNNPNHTYTIGDIDQANDDLEKHRCRRTFWPFIRAPNPYKCNYIKSKLQSLSN